MSLEKYAAKTDLAHRLSYDSGIKNMVGVLHTNLQVGIVIKNGTDKDQNVYISPSHILGVNCLADRKSAPSESSVFADVLTKLRLPKGVNAMHSEPGIAQLEIRPTDADHDLELISSEIAIAPIMVKAISLTSLSNAGGADTRNTSGVINLFNVSAFRPMKRRTIDLASEQKAQNFHNNILKLDLIAKNMPATISSSDLMSVNVAAGTTLTLTLHIGARDHQAERFFRDVAEGTKLILDKFPTEVDSSCGCK